MGTVAFTVVDEFFTPKEFAHQPQTQQNLEKKELRRIKKHIIPKGGVRTIERDMDVETIRSIMMHFDVKGKSMVLCLASGGMRLNELLAVTVDDVNLNVVPAELIIRGTTAKNGQDRLTFVSAEAAQAIREWLKVRDQYLTLSMKRNEGFARNGRSKAKTPDDNRLFPFSDNIAITMWENALQKSGFHSKDKSTGRSQIHLHMLRKFFISQLSLLVSKEIPEVLAGHAGYLTNAYRRYTKAQLAEQYLKAEHLVTVAMPKKIHELQTEFQAKMATHSEILESIVRENIQLKDTLVTMTGKVTTLEEVAEGQRNNLNLMVDLWGDLATQQARMFNDPELMKGVQAALMQYRARSV